jgi:hypothetical protein
LLGRGSVIGANSVLSENNWNYNATCKSMQSTLVLLISKETLLSLADLYKDFEEELK